MFCNADGFLSISLFSLYLVPIFFGKHKSLIKISLCRKFDCFYNLLSQSVLKHLYLKGNSGKPQLFDMKICKNSVTIGLSLCKWYQTPFLIHPHCVWMYTYYFCNLICRICTHHISVKFKFCELFAYLNYIPLM